MAAINFTLSVDHTEARDIIMSTGDTLSTILQSEPGVGKTSILSMIAEAHGDKWRNVHSTAEECKDDKYDYIYVDCPAKDVPDIGMAIPNHETRTLEYYVAGLFKLTSKKPKVIMLDEYAKAPKVLHPVYTRMLLERTAGDEPLPKASIVFGTSNNASDGVGDVVLAHTVNRVNMLQLRKTSAEVWNLWAGKNGINRIIRAWVAMNSRALASYTDSNQADNPFIFKPSGMAKPFVSPRSLAAASVIIDRKDKYSENAMMCSLAGTIGESAARSMAAFISMESSIIRYKDIVADPEGVRVPTDIAALTMMMFEAIDNVQTQDDLSKFMRYVNRIAHAEVQSIFFTMVIKGKPRLARYNEQITKWAADNHMIM